MRLIDADALTKRLFEISSMYEPVIEIVAKSPTISSSSVVRAARWKSVSEVENGKRVIWNRCSDCNWPRRGRTPYCPNCGAKMETEQ